MSRRVVALVPDLFFSARIAETARTLGIDLATLDAGAALAACRAIPGPDLVVVDLAGPGDPVGWIEALKSDPATARVPVTAFHAHVDRAVRAAAEAAGADRVLARSAFSARLAEVLAGTWPAGPGATLPGRNPASPPHPRAVSMTPESVPSSQAKETERVRISCPGCGRNDYVSWPVGQAVFHWKCFNCSKEFDLTRDAAH